MGAEQSISSEKKIENYDYKYQKTSKLSEYNWIPSFISLNNQNIEESNKYLLTKNIDSDTNKNGDTSGDINSEPIEKERQFSKYVDLRRNMPILDMEDKDGTQVVKAFSLIINYELLISKNLYTFPPSFQYLKFLLTNIVGSQQLHSFSHISQAIRQFGICSEADYQNYPQRPQDIAFHNASPFRHMRFNRVETNIEKIKEYLSKQKPLVIGFPIYSNFLKTESQPKLTLYQKDDILLGGLVALIVGFQEDDMHFIVRTSKGKRWGQNGDIFIPYQYLLNSGAEVLSLEIMEELVLLDLEKNSQVLNNSTIVNTNNTNNTNNSNNNQDLTLTDIESHQSRMSIF